MNHREAVNGMTTERYLLDELTPELRDAFEEHLFDCPECASDLRAGAAFVGEARVQLPGLTAQSPPRLSTSPSRTPAKKPHWFSFWQPSFAIPAFGVLLAVIGYQNLATIPRLRSQADQPLLLPWVSLHAGTRGAAHMPVLADRKQGAVLLIDLPQESLYASYVFELYDSQSKRFWTQTVAAPIENDIGEAALSLLIPGSRLQPGSYTLDISGVTSQGGRTRIDRRVFDIHFNE